MSISPFAGCACGLAALLPAQVSVPVGFRPRDIMVEVQRPAAVRALLPLPGDASLVAMDRDLWHRRPGSRDQLLRRLHVGEEFAFLALDAGGRALVGELHRGQVHGIDPTNGAVLTSWRGVPNAFTASALANGDLLVSANPNWPAPGANTGIWLTGPGRTPRELLPLSGPSGPFLLLANGDLVVAELGPIVPPPPGAARLLRFLSTSVQQAIAGGTLTTSQAVAVAPGTGGFYGLAADDRGNLYATDAGSSIVQRRDAFTLAPLPSMFDVGTGRSGLWLHFAPDTAPFAPFQPTARAGSLCVGHSDWVTQFATTRIEPRRPELAATPQPLPPGPGSLTVVAAPASGVCAVFAMPGPALVEQPVVTIAGLPVWSSLPTAAMPVGTAPIDATGAATLAFANPGGFAIAVTFQALAFGAGSLAAPSTSNPLTIQLLP